MEARLEQQSELLSDREDSLNESGFPGVLTSRGDEVVAEMRAVDARGESLAGSRRLT
jgi:hypothetical protein